MRQPFYSGGMKHRLLAAAVLVASLAGADLLATAKQQKPAAQPDLCVVPSAT